LLFAGFSPDNQYAVVVTYRYAVELDSAWEMYSPGCDLNVYDLNGQETHGPASSPFKYAITSYTIVSVGDSMAKVGNITVTKGNDFTSNVPDTATIVFLPIKKPNPPTAVKRQLLPNKKNLSAQQNMLKNVPIARQKLFDALGRVAPASLFTLETQRIRNSQILFRKGSNQLFLRTIDCTFLRKTGTQL